MKDNRIISTDSVMKMMISEGLIREEIISNPASVNLTTLSIPASAYWAIGGSLSVAPN